MILKDISRGIRSIGRSVRKVLSWALGIQKPKDPRGMEIMQEGSDLHEPVIYGERIVGGKVVHKWVTNSISGISGIQSVNRDNAYLHLIVTFAHGEVEEIGTVYFNGEPQTVAKYGNAYAIFRRNGSDTQAAIPQAVQNISNWFEDARGRGVAYAYIVLYQDKDQQIWQGEPEIQAIVKGRKLYDPRTETTAYSQNPALAALDYLTNNIYGRGLPLSRIDVDAFIEAANFCDEGTSSTVTRTTCVPDADPTAPPVCTTETITISQPRYLINAIIDTEAKVFDNYRELLQVFRAYPRRPNGKVSLFVEDVAPAEFPVFDETELVGDLKYRIGGQKDRFNRFIVRFPNRLDRYERDEFMYPQPSDPLFDEWLAEDNGKELIGELELNTISDTSCAAQTAEIAAKVSRISGLLATTLPPRARLLEPGDIIGINSDRYGWTAKPFRIMKIGETDNGDFQVDLSEHEDAAYPWSGAAWDEQVGGSWLGNPDEIPQVQNVQIQRDQTYTTSGIATWNPISSAFIEGYQVTVYDTDDDSEVFSQFVRSSAISIPMFEAGIYRIEVQARNRLQRLGEAGVADLFLLAPQIFPPEAISVESGNFTIKVIPNGGELLGDLFEFDISTSSSHTPQPVHRGKTHTFEDLTSGTEYFIFVRPVNNLGAADWTVIQATTTQSIDPFIPIFGETFDAIDADIDEVRQRITDEVSRIDLDIEAERQRITDEVSRIDLGIELDRSRLRTLETNTRAQIAKTTDSNAELLRSVADAAIKREELRTKQRLNERLIDAVVEIDPDSGTIINKAFAYTDTSFNQAELLIDGVNAQIQAAVQRITFNEEEVEDLRAEFTLLPAQITAIATSVSTVVVAEAIAALEPAYLFNFFDSAQGWVAVNGTLSSTTAGRIDLTLGDIENSELLYDTDENGNIRIDIERVSGDGWIGDLIVEFDDNTTETYSGIIDEIEGNVRLLRSIDLRGMQSYTGNVVRLRLVLGATTSDEFIVRSITIGKADAQTQEFAQLTARVAQAELDINANTGAINQRVTVTRYEDDQESGLLVTSSNFSQTLDADAGYGAIQGTVSQINADGTIAKANAAGLFIDTYEGTFTAYVEQTDLTLGNFASAINQLNVDVSPQGALAQSITQLESSLDTERGRIDAQALTIQEIETDVEGNSSAISGLSTRVDNVETESSASTLLLQQSELDSEGNTKATVLLEARIDTTENELDAQSQLILDARSDIDDNTSAIGGLTTRVIDVETQSQASADLLLSSEFDAQGNTIATAQLSARLDNAEDEIDAQANLILQARQDIDGNTSAIGSLGTRVTDVETQSQASTDLLLASELDSEGNTKATAILSARVDGAENDISAQTGLILQAQNDIAGNTNAIAGLDTRVVDVENLSAASANIIAESGLDEDGNTKATIQLATDVTFIEENYATTGAVNTELDAVRGTIRNTSFRIGVLDDRQEDALIAQTNALADYAAYIAGQTDVRINFSRAVNQLRADVSPEGALAQSITDLEASVATESGRINATNTLLQQAMVDIEGNASSTATIASGITGESDEGQALLRLESLLTEGGLTTRAFFGTDNDGRVTGIIVNDDGNENVIAFQSGAVVFNDNNNEPVIFFDTINNRYSFRGEVIAEAGTFAGLVRGGSIAIGGTEQNPNFAVDGSGNVAIKQGSIDLGGGVFTVDNGGNLSASNADITGKITSEEGTIGSWIIDTDTISSAASGARIVLDKPSNRIGIYDSSTEKVAIGYLAGLPDPNGGTYASNQYGIFVAEGDEMVVDGRIAQEGGSWLVEEDASIRIQRANESDIIRLGTDAGNKGLFLYDSSNTVIGEFSDNRIFFGDSEQFLQVQNGNITFSGAISNDKFSVSAEGGVVASDVIITGGSLDIGSSFSVDNAGNLVATSANISGNITITEGSINLGSGTFTVSNSGAVVADDLTLTGGGINLGGGTFTVSNTGAVTASNVTITGGSLSIGANFSVTNAGVLTATGATINGEIVSSSGVIGGWGIQPNLLRSATSGARLELNANANRVSVFDAVNEKVAMGYLGGLPRFDGSGNWTASDYGFWARQGDNLVIDGNVEYVNGDWIIENDATLKIQTGAGHDVINLGTNAGNKGLFIFDGTSSRNLRAEFRQDRIYAGSSGNSIEWTPTSGLVVSGTITASDFVGGTIDIGSGTFTVSNAGSVVADDLTLTGGGINLGNGTFTVDNAGHLVASGVEISGEVSGSSFETTETSGGLRSILGKDGYRIWVGIGEPDAVGSEPFLFVRDDGLPFVAREFVQEYLPPEGEGGTITQYSENTFSNTAGNSGQASHTTKGSRIDVTGTVDVLTVQVEGDHRNGAAFATVSLQRNNATIGSSRQLPMTVFYDSTLGMNGTTIFLLSGTATTAVSGLTADSTHNFRATVTLSFPLSVILPSNPTVTVTVRTNEVF